MKHLNRNRLLYVIPAIILFLTVAACSATENISKSQKDQTPIQQANFEISPLTVTPRWLFVGDNATVSVNVRNSGSGDGTYDAILLIDGQKSGEQEVRVPHGQSKTVSFGVPATSATAKSVAIGDSKETLNYYQAKPYDIQYDNYELQSSKPLQCYYNQEPYGQMVRFTAAAKPFRVNKIQMAAMVFSKAPSDIANKVFTMNIWDSTRKKLWTGDFPWNTYGGGWGPTWQDLDVPNIPADNDFYVELVSHTPAGQGSTYAGTGNTFGLGYNGSDSLGRSSSSYQGQIYWSSSQAANLIDTVSGSREKAVPIRCSITMTELQTPTPRRMITHALRQLLHLHTHLTSIRYRFMGTATTKRILIRLLT